MIAGRGRIGGGKRHRPRHGAGHGRGTGSGQGDRSRTRGRDCGSGNGARRNDRHTSGCRGEEALRTDDLQREPIVPGPPTPRAAAQPIAELRSAQPLMSPQSDAAVAGAFSQLASSMLARSGRTLDELAEDLLRPMLRNWLDDNLPPWSSAWSARRSSGFRAAVASRRCLTGKAAASLAVRLTSPGPSDLRRARPETGIGHARQDFRRRGRRAADQRGVGEGGGLPRRRRRQAGRRALFDRHSAAERDRLAAYRPRPQQHPPGRPDPLRADARPRRSLAAGHGPCRHRHADGRRAPDDGAAGARAAATSAARSSSRRSGHGRRSRAARSSAS